MPCRTKEGGVKPGDQRPGGYGNRRSLGTNGNLEEGFGISQDK